jgi:hypothetical protein
MMGDELLDGRNRLEAAERVKFKIGGGDIEHLPAVDPVRFVISANINRRHLTKAQRADLIVAAIKAGEACRQVGEVPPRHVKGKAGSEKDATKAAIVADAAANKISKRTVERAIAKAEGKTPKPKRRTSAEVEAEHLHVCKVSMEAAWDSADPELWGYDPKLREHLIKHIAKESDPVSLALSLVEMMDAEQVERLIAGAEEHRAQLGRKRASQKSADPNPEIEVDDDLGDIPPGLDRRRVV